jgi:hypothetical protein
LYSSLLRITVERAERAKQKNELAKGFDESDSKGNALG